MKMKMSKSEAIVLIGSLLMTGLALLVTGCLSFTVMGDVYQRNEFTPVLNTQLGVTSSAQTSGSTNEVFQEREGGGVRDNAVTAPMVVP